MEKKKKKNFKKWRNKNGERLQFSSNGTKLKRPKTEKTVSLVGASKPKRKLVVRLNTKIELIKTEF